jgi:hypothetical protein
VTITTLLTALAARPWLAALAIAWIIVVLHVPYRYEWRRDARGRTHGVWQSAMYRYEYGPTYERLRYDGLRRLQRIILGLLRDAWRLLRGDVLRRLVDELRRRLGL